MATLYTNPYALDAQGFSFEGLEQFDQMIKSAKWEECEIGYLDGDNPKLFEAANIHQGNIPTWYEQLDHLSDDDHEALGIRYLLDCGYELEEALNRADEVHIYEGRAEDYAAELLSDIYDLDSLPAIILFHINYQGIASDMETASEICELEHDVWVTNCLDF